MTIGEGEGEDMSRKIRETSPSLVEGFCNFNRPIALREALSLSIPKDTFCNTLPSFYPPFNLLVSDKKGLSFAD